MNGGTGSPVSPLLLRDGDTVPIEAAAGKARLRRQMLSTRGGYE